MKLCHCHTADCPNNGVPFQWDDSPTDTAGGDVIMTQPWCGGCSTQFTDITETEDQPDGS